MRLPFSGYGDNVVIAASTTSAAGALPGAVAAGQSRAETMRVYNATSSPAFFRTGVAAPTAVTTDTFIAPGSTEVFSLPPGVEQVAVILGSGTGNVYFQRGAGS